MKIGTAAELAASWKEAFVEQVKMQEASTDAGLETLASLDAERVAHAETKRERDEALKALELAEQMMTKDSLCEAERLEEGLLVVRRALERGKIDA